MPAEPAAVTSMLPVLGFGDDTGVSIDLQRLVSTRLLIQANSGGGKSWAIRSLLEQSHGLIQQVILDWEGEFATLRELFDYVLVGGEGADLPARPETAAALCRRLLELNASAVLDLSSLRTDDRQAFAETFLSELMAVERAFWRPLLVVIDEAHLLCPEAGQGEASSRQAVIDLCTLGRKRGFCAILATQRIAKVSNHALAELGNVLIGPTSFSPDVRRAAETLGFDRRQSESLKRLEPGQFWSRGPAISREPVLVRTGQVRTSHPEPGGIAPPAPPAPEAIRALLAELSDLTPASAPHGETPSAGCDHIDELEMLHAEIRQRDREIDALRSADLLNRASEAHVRLDSLVERLQPALESAQAAAAAAKLVWRTLDELRSSSPLTSGAAASPTAELVAEPLAGSPPDLPEDSVPRAADGTPQPSVATENNSTSIPRGNIERAPVSRLLDAVATLEVLGEEPQRLAVAVLAGFSASGGHFQRLVGTAVENGWLKLDGRGGLGLTSDGWERARPISIDSLSEYHTHWLDRLDGAPLRVFSELLDGCPGGQPVARELLAVWSGLSADGGYYGKALRRLTQLGFIVRPSRSEVQASPLLYPAGLS